MSRLKGNHIRTAYTDSRYQTKIFFINLLINSFLDTYSKKYFSE